MSPQAVISHEGQPLLHQRVKGTIGPGGRLERIEDHRRFKTKVLVAATLLIGAATIIVRPLDSSRWGGHTIGAEQSLLHQNPISHSDLCNDRHCFKKTVNHVREDQPGFPSFWNYAPYGPITVTYDQRAILLNGTRSLFLGGSMHPARATPETWEAALDEAVRNGLNLITIYVFWSVHQPFPNSPYDWSLPGKKQRCKGYDSARVSSCRWDLASAIQQAANRGLFVHARIGPYACAEYSYGGIPEWIALNKPTMSMRRPNQEWMDAMEGFLKETIRYFTQEKLWAHQGGPIILGQVENELGGDLDPVTDNVVLKYDNKGVPRASTMQDYADWSGETAAKYAPNVLWTMCNGLTASNAINTCNGYGGVSCSQGWLESHGQNGRIQVDQPALWTEDEGGFQVWGETPSNSSYFWGRTARDFARDELKWFARGGTHLNYYMFWGSYNRGRAAAGGITNMYADDAMLCPSGERRQPKYGHLQALHELVIELAPVLLNAPSALFKNQTVSVMGPDGHWVPGKEQQLFMYANDDRQSDSPNEIAFIENDSSKSLVVRASLPKHGDQLIKMKGFSCVVIVDGMQLFDSAAINPEMKAFQRETIESPVDLLDWQSFKEPVGVDPKHPKTQNWPSPVEQTSLMISSRVSSDYAWYQTNFLSYANIYNATLLIDTQKASALSVYLNGKYIGSQDDPHHEEGNITFSINLGDITPAWYRLSVLSENLGYGNLIGRWGASTKAKTKGITGSVWLDGLCGTRNCRINLVDGRDWHSFAGLHGATFDDRATEDVPSLPGVWSRAHFDTPMYNAGTQSLFLDITSGRGQLWLNGNDLGRFWNITRGETMTYSQRYYMLPREHLYYDGHLNELLIFNSQGGDLSSTQLVLSGLVAADSSKKTFEDEVNFPSACI